MGILLGAGYFVTGLAVGLVILACVVARNSRRIKRLESRAAVLERRERAQDYVIRHLAEASIDPDDEPPPSRSRPRIFKGAAGLAAAAAVVRRHPARVVVGGTGTVAATALAVAVVAQIPATPTTAAPGLPSIVASVRSVATATPTAGLVTPSSASPTLTVSSPAPLASGTASAIASPRPRTLMAVVKLPRVGVSVSAALPDAAVPALPTGVPLPPLPAPTGLVPTGLFPSSVPSCVPGAPPPLDLCDRP